VPDVILFNKPWGVLSQFSDREGRRTLADFVQAPGFRPAGRLDYDSEGLLVLCDDGALQARIASPRFKLAKTYLVFASASRPLGSASRSPRVATARYGA
jgi:23S rRNA pseudouridine2457 synthase